MDKPISTKLPKLILRSKKANLEKDSSAKEPKENPKSIEQKEEPKSKENPKTIEQKENPKSIEQKEAQTKKSSPAKKSVFYPEKLEAIDFKVHLHKLLENHLGNEDIRLLSPDIHELEFRLGYYDINNNNRFNAFVSVITFNRLMQYFNKQIGDYSENISLDIIYDENFRATITSPTLVNSRNLIKYFNSTNKLPSEGTSFMEKQQIRSTDSVDWNFRTTSSYEKLINDPDKILVYTKKIEDQTTSKFYRYKNRFSFVLDEKMRLDLTIVKESLMSSGTLASSGCLNKTNKEKYQVELEYTGKDFNAERLSEIVYPQLNTVLAIFQNNMKPISQSMNNLMIEHYLQLISNTNTEFKAEDLRVYSTSKFLAMDVEALTRQNLDTIRSHYHVTIKADGEHYLLYLTKEHGGFLINNRLEAGPVTFEDYIDLNTIIEGDTILDGELVDYQGRKRFMVFDCFFYNGADMRDKPLFTFKAKADKSASTNPTTTDGKYSVDQDCRYFYVKEITSKFKKEILSDKMVIEAKEYYPSTSVSRYFDSTNFRFKENDFPYNVDGLIYTPSQDPYPKISYKANRFIKTGSMDDNDIKPILKWKPPEYMSVDFKVKYSHTETINTIEYYVFLLESTYKQKIHTFEPSSYRVKGYNLAYIPSTNGLPRLIKDPTSTNTNTNTSTNTNAHIKVDDKSVGHIIKDKDIIEFIWTREHNLGPDFWGRWVPIKYRDDKTQIGYPNNFLKVADRTWLAINDKQITGKILMQLEPSIQLNMGYYKNTRKDSEIAMPHLRDVHNAIKSLLINLSVRNTPNKNSKLLDLASGRGGDISKWSGLNYVLGVEFDESNLKAGNQSAYARYGNYIDNQIQTDRQDKSHLLRIDFIQGNMGLQFKDVSFTQEKIYNHMLNSIIKNPNNFGIVSCQFAIHYIWDTEEHIDNFFNNVSRNLMSGGYFIATTFDGEKVFDELKKNKSTDAAAGADADADASIEGKDQSGQIIWEITNMTAFGKTLPNFGHKIKVLNKTIKDVAEMEYLVNFDYLTEVAKKYNLEPASLLFEKQSFPFDNQLGTYNFHEIYQNQTEFLNMFNNTKIYSKQLYNKLEESFEKMSGYEKKFSKFNSIIVFRKK